MASDPASGIVRPQPEEVRVWDQVDAGADSIRKTQTSHHQQYAETYVAEGHTTVMARMTTVKVLFAARRFELKSGNDRLFKEYPVSLRCRGEVVVFSAKRYKLKS